MKSWPRLPVRESTIIPQHLPLKEPASPDISWSRWSRSASMSSSTKEPAAMPVMSEHSAASRHTSRVSLSVALPLKAASDWSSVDQRRKDRKPVVMVIWVILLVLAVAALLFDNYQRQKKRGISFRAGTASEEAVPNTVTATGSRPSPQPSRKRITRWTRLQQSSAVTERLTRSVIETRDDETIASKEWGLPVNGTNVTTVDATGR
ncbi:hypothetical protein HPB50_002035 [Hyalomma asiaticum]|uniref:Uncharacterized protein n=1 Tax=Hyalomma asiaticum TaxID=266040 RepID=A0ACB7SB71_HYAAI|nr:hypothetical protein HPB50_002035 [Hyalomma asiaticum]